MDTRTGEIFSLTKEQYQTLVDTQDEKVPYLMPITPTSKQMKVMKVGRNDLCPCGSGVKFKKCHLGKEIT